MLPQFNLSHLFVLFFGVVAFGAQGTHLFFFRQAQNCHILNPPLMMEGFLCCSSACHCEAKKNKKKKRPGSLFFPGFAISHVEDLVSCFWKNNGAQSWPLKMRLPLYKQWHEAKKRCHRVTIDLPFTYREFFFFSSPLAWSRAQLRAGKYSGIKLEKNKVPQVVPEQTVLQVTRVSEGLFSCSSSRLSWPGHFGHYFMRLRLCNDPRNGGGGGHLEALKNWWPQVCFNILCRCPSSIPEHVSWLWSSPGGKMAQKKKKKRWLKTFCFSFLGSWLEVWS